MEKFEALDIKGKLLVITSDEEFNRSRLESLRDGVRKLGGLGIICVSPDWNVSTENVDTIIAQLQKIKATNGKGQN